MQQRRVRTLKADVSITRRSWFQDALSDRSEFQRDLAYTGIPSTLAADGLRIRDDVSRGREARERLVVGDSDASASPASGIDLEAGLGDVAAPLRNWWNGVSVSREDGPPVSIEVPIFVLAAPSTDGSKAKGEFAQQTTASSEWSIALGGSGLTGSATLSLKKTSAFAAASGEIRQIFQKVSVPTFVITTRSKDGSMESKPQADLSNAELVGNLGDASIEETPRLRAGEPVDRYFTRKVKPPTGLADFSYEPEAKVSLELKLGVKIRGVDLGLKAKVERLASMKLTYSLREGFDYELMAIADGEGYVFRLA